MPNVGDSELPQGWRNMSLSEIFSQEQLTQVIRLINEIRTRITDAKDLRTYLRSQEQSLQEKGFVPDYLYYALCYKFDLFR